MAPRSGDLSQVGFVPPQGAQVGDGPSPTACFLPSALALLKGRNISNCNGNIRECSIKWAAQEGQGGDVGQGGQQAVSGVRLREGNALQRFNCKDGPNGTANLTEGNY